MVVMRFQKKFGWGGGELYPFLLGFFNFAKHTVWSSLEQLKP